MKINIILGFGCLIAFMLVLTGIPIGYFMSDSKPYEQETIYLISIYRYISILIVGFFCFYLLSRCCEVKFFLHGLVVLLLVNAASLLIDTLLFGGVDLLVWFLDFVILLLTLVIVFGLTAFRKRNYTF